MTHEDKHSIGISFPTFHHLLVLYKCTVKIHGEYSFRTIGKVGLPLQGFILLGLIYGGCSQREGEEVIIVSYLDPAQPGIYHEKYKSTEASNEMILEGRRVQWTPYVLFHYIKCCAWHSPFRLAGLCDTSPRYRTTCWRCATPQPRGIGARKASSDSEMKKKNTHNDVLLYRDLNIKLFLHSRHGYCPHRRYNSRMFVRYSNLSLKFPENWART
jgi:hypothetical protein